MITKIFISLFTRKQNFINYLPNYKNNNFSSFQLFFKPNQKDYTDFFRKQGLKKARKIKKP